LHHLEAKFKERFDRIVDMDDIPTDVLQKTCDINSVGTWMRPWDVFRAREGDVRDSKALVGG
jgi:hypothetical protein